ncbi:MAG: hypothetical protein IJ121_02210 [Eubacterium sp.]|nr:hypothetical protein [Eubacterium sp.]
MTEQEARKKVDERVKIDPEFKKKYDAHMAKYAGSGKLEAGELAAVNGGIGVVDITSCPKCGASESLCTVCFGIYWWCENCDYTEWF